jgi:hypothetical protein
MFKFKNFLFILIVKKTIKYKHDLPNTPVAAKNKAHVLVDQILFLWFLQRRTLIVLPERTVSNIDMFVEK